MGKAIVEAFKPFAGSDHWRIERELLLIRGVEFNLPLISPGKG
jgi:hypothetical protein